MLPVKETQHVKKARALLIEQYKGRPIIQGFLDSYIKRIQDLEDALWDIINSRRLDLAVGLQLDVLGLLVGELRLGRTDEEYRPSIRIRIRVNRSRGRIVDVIDVAKLVNVHGTPIVIEYRYLGFEVNIFEEEGERYTAALLDKTRAATSYGLLVSSSLPPEDILRFDDFISPIPDVITVTDYLEEFP